MDSRSTPRTTVSRAGMRRCIREDLPSYYSSSARTGTQEMSQRDLRAASPDCTLARDGAHLGVSYDDIIRTGIHNSPRQQAWTAVAFPLPE